MKICRSNRPNVFFSGLSLHSSSGSERQEIIGDFQHSLRIPFSLAFRKACVVVF